MKEILSVHISGVDSRGRGTSMHDDGRPIAVSWALPGDVVDVRVTRRRGGLLQSTPTAIHGSTIPRIAARCSHFDACGGCTLQEIAYGTQLELKEAMVRAAFSEAEVPMPPSTEAILPAPRAFHYRNKLEYSFGAQRWLSAAEIASGEEIGERRALGFHAPGRFDRVLPIEECHLQPEPTNAIRNALDTFARERDFTYYHATDHVGLLRLLIIRTSLTGEVMVTVMFGENETAAIDETMRFLGATFPGITSLNYVVNTSANDSIYAHDVVSVSGTPYITERCGDLRLRIRPKAFYQTNPEQAERLYAAVADVAAVRATDAVFDLFSGIGSIGMYLAARVSRVVAIESVPDAVSAARENAGINGIGNIVSLEGTVEERLAEAITTYGVPDVMVIDPPRAGMHPSTLPLLLESGAPRIVYVSCNPRSQARDIRVLLERYRFSSSRAVDMFPQTRHVENIAVLERR